MSDDRIREYLRARANGLPPPDLADAISRTASATPQERRSWFASFMPAATALGVAAAVIATAVVLGQDPTVGPRPSASPSATAEANPTVRPDPSVAPTPSPTPLPTAEGEGLTQVGVRESHPAEDATGAWGTVTVMRIAEVGGLHEIVEVDLDVENPDPTSMYFVNDPSMFYLELLVEYLADREPDPLDFGADDWLVIGGLEPIEPIDVGLDALGSHFPGAMAVVGDPIRGILRFAIPRDLATTELSLAYQPIGFDEPAWTTPLRTPAEPPEPITVVTPEPIVYVERPGMPISVVDSAGADALFAAPDTCTNPVAGYTVSYPDDWYTNTAVGSWPACSWFSPTVFDVGEDPDVVPAEVLITIQFHPDSGPFGELSEAIAGGPVEVGARPATRAEYVGVGGGFIDIGSFVYQYRVAMSGQAPEEGETGDTLTARAWWVAENDPEAYRLSTAVLDRIMASLTFDE